MKDQATPLRPRRMLAKVEPVSARARHDVPGRPAVVHTRVVEDARLAQAILHHCGRCGNVPDVHDDALTVAEVGRVAETQRQTCRGCREGSTVSTL